MAAGYSPTHKYRKWMAMHSREYETATELAEACAQQFNEYESDDSIPELIFELAQLEMDTWQKPTT